MKLIDYIFVLSGTMMIISFIVFIVILFSKFTMNPEDIAMAVCLFFSIVFLISGCFLEKGKE